MAYTTTAELARIVLKNRTPTNEQEIALQRVLDIAEGEINAEIDLADDATALAGWQLDLCAQVNLDRAADLWFHTESGTGLTGLLGDEGVLGVPGRYSWKRYAERLAPLKSQWGLA